MVRTALGSFPWEEQRAERGAELKPLNLAELRAGAISECVEAAGPTSTEGPERPPRRVETSMEERYEISASLLR